MSKDCCGPARTTADCCDAGTPAAGTCCGPAAAEPGTAGGGTCCSAPSPAPADHLYPVLACVTGTVETPAGPVPQVSRDLGRSDRLGAARVRMGFGRDDYRVRPGLYALGTPGEDSPVLVTANYKLTFDHLRSSVGALEAWLVVADTRGVNVWCAAGEGTFCAEEIARVVTESRLAEIVAHRVLVLPQLGGPGVAAHRLKGSCGFRAVFGPVRAADIPAFLAAGMRADAAMREVTFTLRERAVLVPEQLSLLRDRRVLLAAAGILAASGMGRGGFSPRRAARGGGPVLGAALLALLAGGVATPLALPRLPGRAFSAKGAVAGGVAAAGAALLLRRRLSPAERLALLAAVPSAASYVAMNFTGSSAITSPSGVEHETRRALPLQAVALVLGAAAWVASRMGA